MRIRLQGPGHASGLLAELNRCRQSRLYCDVLLQAGGRSFPAHRAVLACAGSHFRSLFSRGPTPAPGGTPTYVLDFISLTSFDKVLTFIYTGEILTDLIDVGVLYELAVRLGVRELVRACHATFPDLQGSAAGEVVAPGPPCGELDQRGAGADSGAAGSVCSSSAASCSSLSSSAGPSAAPTPALPSPLPQGRPSRPGRGRTTPLPLALKAEDIHSHLGYGQIDASGLLGGEKAGLGARTEGVVTLQLKTEQGADDEEEERGKGSCDEGRTGTSGRSGDGSLPPCVSEACSFRDSSALMAEEASDPPSSSEDPLVSLQVGAVESGGSSLRVGAVEGGGSSLRVGAVEGGGDSLRVVVAERGENTLQVAAAEGGMADGEEDGDEEMEEQNALQADGADVVEQWRQLAGEIIELSDDENFLEEEEDDGEDDLVCVENGGGSDQASVATATCKACGMSLLADSVALRSHAETHHLTELGACRVCGAVFPERGASVTHALSHVGVLLFSCDMCRLQFCSQTRLLRHRRQASASYTPPASSPGPGSAPQGLTPEVQCAVCSKALTKDFQVVRDHLLSHVCPQSLSCGVCQLSHASLCALLWHAFTHLSLPVHSCPHCACSFLERPLLDRHMVTHAEEEVSAVQQLGPGARQRAEGEEELSCFLCPQTFHSSSAFHYHLSLHSSEPLGGSALGWPGKRKADQALDYPPSTCPSSSPLEAAGGLGKLSGLGFGLGINFSLSDKLLQGAGPHFPPGLLTNGSSGPDAGAAPRNKWYRCRYCGKRFAHSGEFTYHLRIHTGEKPYQCKVCLRFFRGRSTMICHLKTHAGALMYRCTVCGLYFSTLKLVSSHMEVHKGHLPPDFNIEQTFMYNDHSKEPLPTLDT